MTIEIANQIINARNLAGGGETSTNEWVLGGFAIVVIGIWISYLVNEWWEDPEGFKNEILGPLPDDDSDPHIR